MDEKISMVNADHFQCRFNVERHREHDDDLKNGKVQIESELESRLRQHPDFIINQRTLYLRPQRWKRGFSRIMLSVASGGLGVFLLSQLRNTPILSVQLAIVGTVGLLVSAVLLNQAFRDLFGKIVVDAHCIKLNYGITHRELSWNDLQYWKVTGSFGSPQSYDKFLLSNGFDAVPIVIPVSWIGEEDRKWLFDVLTHIMRKE